MSKYIELTKCLASLEQGVWETTFSELEQETGIQLPASARKHPAWWANQGHTQSASWKAAGWKTASVDVQNERVTFLYVGHLETDDDEAVAPLTIADAKAGLATHFGVSVDAIEITIRG